MNAVGTSGEVRRERGGSLPPGPRLPSPLQVAWFVRDRLDLLDTCGARYGEFFTVRFPWETLVFTWNPDAMKQFLIDSAL